MDELILIDLLIVIHTDIKRYEHVFCENSIAFLKFTKKEKTLGSMNCYLGSF